MVGQRSHIEHAQVTQRAARAALHAPWPTLLYLATTLVGVWAAYDRPTALGRCALLALGLLGAVGIGWLAQRRGAGGLLVAAGVLAAAIGVYYLLAYDPSASGYAQFWVLQRLVRRIQAHRPALLLPPLHKNAAGGALAVLLPFALAGIYWVWSKRRWGWLAVAAITSVIGVVAFILVASRGAWLGLGLGVLAAAFLHQWSSALRSASGAAPRPLRWAGPLVLLGLPLAVLLTFAVALTTPRLYELLLLPVQVGSQEGLTRLQVWWDAVTLIEDYPFTGSGLGSTTMVYSSYVRLLSVPYFGHMHHLYLQLAVEQGLPGLLAFLWLAGDALHRLMVGARRERPSVVRLTALASLVALLAHGMLDAQLYVSPLVPLMFLPFGCAQALAPRARSACLGSRLAWGLVGVVLAALVLLPQSRSLFESNLAAVMQTHTELSVYTFRDWGFQDAVRRARADELGPAVAAYQLALSHNPANASANRRLGQLQLSLGRYEMAGQYLAAAYRADPLPRPTGLLLGEYYAIHGELQKAVGVWSTTMDARVEQLNTRQVWYKQVGEPEHAKQLSAAVAALFSPPQPGVGLNNGRPSGR